MNSRERVMRTIEGLKVDRVPLFMDCTTEDVLQKLIEQVGAKDEDEMLEKLGIDCRWCNCMEDIYPYNTYTEGTYIDMWGIEKTNYGGIPVSHPLEKATTVEEIENYPNWPNPDNISCEKYIKKMEKYQEYCVFGGMWSPFLEQASLLMGMENLMIMMYENPEVVDCLLDKTVNFYLECNRRMFELAGDKMQIFFMGDDYGTQQSLLYSPELWCRFVKPRLQKLYDLAKSYGYKVMQHSCGSVEKIIPDLIEIGLDGLHPIQVTAQGMNPKVLKDKYGKQIYFAGSIDAMRLLINGSKEQIEKEVKEMIAILGENGGFILGPSQGFLPEIPVEHIEYMYDVALKYGTY